MRAPRVATVLALVLTPVVGTVLQARAASHGVTIVDNAYQPRTITITVGDTITWTDDGTNPHSVTSNTGQAESFDSSPGCSQNPVANCMKRGNTFSHTFTHAGTFTYYCQIHGSPGDTTCPMCGIITVRAAATSSPRPTTPPSSQPQPTHGPRPTVAASTASRLPQTGGAELPMAAVGLWAIAAGFTMIAWAARRRAGTS